MATAPTGGPVRLATVLVVALALHLGLLATGFWRVSNDEAARVLMAWSLTPGNALEPFVWPPLHRLLLGGALALFPDPVWVPRLVSVALGLGVLAAVLGLARRVSSDPAVLLATAALATLSPHRLLLGSVPLADILLILLVVLGAERVTAWLQGGRAGALLAGCALVGLATAVRYEAWFIGLTLGLLVFWHWLRGRRVDLRLLAACAGLIGWFPLFWIAQTWAWYGSLASLGVTSAQFRAIAGEEAGRLLLILNPLGHPLMKEVAWSPATGLGLATLLVLAWRDRALRGLALGFVAALPLMAAVMFATGSVPLAASWRVVGVWALLALPFGALALVRLAGWAAARLRVRRAPALALLLLPALLLPAIRDLRLAREGMWNWETRSWRHDAEAGRAAVEELERLGGGLAVLDSLGNLDFLEVMVGSGEPDLFVTSADVPAPRVALHVPMAGHLRATGAAEAERYLADRFGLRRGGDAEALRARGIRVAVVRDPAARAALDASGHAERLREWPDWALYRLAPRPVLSEAPR